MSWQTFYETPNPTPLRPYNSHFLAFLFTGAANQTNLVPTLHVTSLQLTFTPTSWPKSDLMNTIWVIMNRQKFTEYQYCTKSSLHYLYWRPTQIEIVCIMIKCKRYLLFFNWQGTRTGFRSMIISISNRIYLHLEHTHSFTWLGGCFILAIISHQNIWTNLWFWRMVCEVGMIKFLFLR